MNYATLFSVIAASSLAAHAGEPLRQSIWQDQAPLGNGKFEKADTSITVHLPNASKATGLAVVICPGGGYGGKVLEGEGHGIARWLTNNGIAGVVLDYRLPQGNYQRPHRFCQASHSWPL